MEGPISFWGYTEQESNLILPEHDDDIYCFLVYLVYFIYHIYNFIYLYRKLYKNKYHFIRNITK